MTKDKIKVLLIDDHPLTRRGLASCLTDTGRCAIVGEAPSLEGARRVMELHFPVDVVILDISLGEENGLDFIGHLKKYCELRKAKIPAVLVCSVYEDPFRIRSAMDSGAMGYVPKSASEKELLQAIDTVMRGELFIDPRLEIKINAQTDAYAKFTKRERDVLALVKQNYDNPRIAAALSLGLHTVENHISHIYFKTGLTKREELGSL
ncbi:DNA-binding response regulator [Treponema primitia ZAS-2]|uniref:DNA-binding response regulator n=1 Tax=Treponema primitia (strain ATCC BAA-887 / DSM 12427 / ZAS-2) TaxID=545694 RepID=F5YIV5_TREPZ|nr:response regulator transcription factor [Treponema primitia]AEF86128.1 DNA-binding response regulator [Treponema primitia ZAS-2]